jgi:hypothetical protein
MLIKTFQIILKFYHDERLEFEASETFPDSQTKPPVHPKNDVTTPVILPKQSFSWIPVRETIDASTPKDATADLVGGAVGRSEIVTHREAFRGEQIIFRAASPPVGIPRGSNLSFICISSFRKISKYGHLQEKCQRWLS